MRCAKAFSLMVRQRTLLYLLLLGHAAVIFTFIILEALHCGINILSVNTLTHHTERCTVCGKSYNVIEDKVRNFRFHYGLLPLARQLYKCTVALLPAQCMMGDQSWLVTIKSTLLSTLHCWIFTFVI